MTSGYLWGFVFIGLIIIFLSGVNALAALNVHSPLLY